LTCLDRRRQARCEDIRRQVWALRQQLIGGAGRHQDALPHGVAPALKHRHVLTAAHHGDALHLLQSTNQRGKGFLFDCTQVTDLAAEHGSYLLPLLRKGAEGIDDEPGRRAVEDADAGRPEPGLKVVDGHGDVLSVALVENPDLPIRCRPRHAVAIVVEQHPLILPGPCLQRQGNASR